MKNKLITHDKNALRKILLNKKKLYPFHMPGHKRNKKFLCDNLLSLDMTEIEDLDNLHEPKEIIKSLQEFCANIFGVKQSFFLVNGSTSGVLASVCAVCSPGDEIIILRNSHKSLYNALELSGAIPVYLYQERFFEFNLEINYYELENLLKKNKNIKAVFITNPSYEGFSLDIKRIARITHEYKKILIIDEAHGTHFNFHDKFPVSAIQSGADIIINSLHKNLNALTQCAVLHVNNKNINCELLKKFVLLFQTTSPSYVFMASIERCLEKILEKNIFERYINKILDIRAKFKSNKILKLIDKKFINIFDLDISKLVFIINSNLSANMINKILRDKYKIQIEMSGINYLIILTSIADINRGYKLLTHAIKNLEKKLVYKQIKNNSQEIIKNKIIMSPREVLFKNKKYIKLKESLDKICADFVIAYPPGVPVIVPGEIISREIIRLIIFYLENHVNIIGLHNNLICVIN